MLVALDQLDRVPGFNRTFAHDGDVEASPTTGEEVPCLRLAFYGSERTFATLPRVSDRSLVHLMDLQDGVCCYTWGCIAPQAPGGGNPLKKVYTGPVLTKLGLVRVRTRLTNHDLR